MCTSGLGPAHLVACALRLRAVHLLKTPLALLEQNRYLGHRRRNQFLLVVVVRKAGKEGLTREGSELGDWDTGWNEGWG